MANVIGGYDDNLIGGYGTGAGVAPAAMASGSTGFLAATLGYFRGNASRSIRMESTGNLRAYPDNLQRPAPGGTGTVDARTTVGRSVTLRASERIGHEPFFSVFSAGASDAPLPAGIGETSTATGLFQRRSHSSHTSVSLDRIWSQRDSTSLSYSYREQQFTDAAHGDNNAQEVLTEYWRRLARGVRVRAAYRYADREFTDYEGTARPTREHRIEGGPEIETALSRRRHLAVALAAGATSVESIGGISRNLYHAWVPVGSARVTLGLSPAWSLEGGYRRGFNLLQGITDEVYTTDTGFLTTRGRVTSRAQLQVAATYSNGRTSLVPGSDNKFRVYGASLQVNVPLTASIAATARYLYYHHRYSTAGALPAGFPAVYDRHAVGIGLTMWVPLVGTGSSSPLLPR